MDSKRHKLLKEICPDWDVYMKGKMGTDTYGADCSCDCKYFMWLVEIGDWGICCNPNSPRKALLTWEHMGCLNFAKESSYGH